MLNRLVRSVVYTELCGQGGCATRPAHLTCMLAQSKRSCYASANPHYIISSSRHLTSGDPCPELSTDTLRLYSMKWCPFAQRTRLALAHKQIRHEEVNINLLDKPSWLLEKNPSGTVPLLELKSSSQPGEVPMLKHVIGSLETCEWLENSCPDAPSLFPKIGETLSSKVLLQFEEVSKVMNAYVYDRIEPRQSTPSKVLSESLESLERLLQPSDYVTGSVITMTDFLLWPSFERILAKGYQIDSKAMPKLSHWAAHMNSLSAVRDVRNSSQGYDRYWESSKQGAPDYDYGYIGS